MLLRGGRREVVVDGAVVALEVDGEGVDVGGEDDDAVVGAVPAPFNGSGVSVIEDMFATPDKLALQLQSISSQMLLAYIVLLKREVSDA